MGKEKAPFTSLHEIFPQGLKRPHLFIGMIHENAWHLKQGKKKKPVLNKSGLFDRHYTYLLHKLISPLLYFLNSSLSYTLLSNKYH